MRHLSDFTRSVKVKHGNYSNGTETISNDEPSLNWSRKGNEYRSCEKENQKFVPVISSTNGISFREPKVGGVGVS